MNEPPCDQYYIPVGEPIEPGGSAWRNGHAAPAQEPPSFVRKVKKAGDFIAEYYPISYTIDGVLPSAMMYGLTGKRGTGKTAIMLTTALALIMGRSDILGPDVEKGRVAYIALENPTDIRMKLAVNAFVHCATTDILNDGMVVIDGRLPPEEIFQQLKVVAEEDGPFQCIFYDTFQAGFSGSEFNNNAEVLAFTQKLRLLTTLPGSPSVIIAFHPTKSAGEEELVPYGGGAIMNELDGNFTLWAENGQIKLGWNKVRGPEFEPRYFQIKQISSPEILDNKGRQILLPICLPVSPQSVEEKQNTEANLDRALLAAMLAAPEASQAEWGMAIGRSKANVNNRLQRLGTIKLTEATLGKWRLTPKGVKEAENT